MRRFCESLILFSVCVLPLGGIQTIFASDSGRAGGQAVLCDIAPEPGACASLGGAAGCKNITIEGDGVETLKKAMDQAGAPSCAAQIDGDNNPCQGPTGFVELEYIACETPPGAF